MSRIGTMVNEPPPDVALLDERGDALERKDQFAAVLGFDACRTSALSPFLYGEIGGPH